MGACAAVDSKVTGEGWGMFGTCPAASCTREAGETTVAFRQEIAADDSKVTTFGAAGDGAEIGIEVELKVGTG